MFSTLNAGTGVDLSPYTRETRDRDRGRRASSMGTRGYDRLTSLCSNSGSGVPSPLSSPPTRFNFHGPVPGHPSPNRQPVPGHAQLFHPPPPHAGGVYEHYGYLGTLPPHAGAACLIPDHSPLFDGNFMGIDFMFTIFTICYKETVLIIH